MFDESLSTPEATTPAEVLKEIKEKTNRLWELKVAREAAEKAEKKAKGELSKILEDSGVEKVQGDLCTVSLALKSSVAVPKDEHGKKKLFDYITEKHGKTVLDGLLTINAKAFASWFGKEEEALIEQGELEPNIAGIEPYTYYSLGMRKRAVKK